MMYYVVHVSVFLNHYYYNKLNKFICCS